jgi:hypothetical protein
MVKMMWHRWETRRQTEKTNIDLQHREEPAYSTRKVGGCGPVRRRRCEKIALGRVANGI